MLYPIELGVQVFVKSFPWVSYGGDCGRRTPESLTHASRTDARKRVFGWVWRQLASSVRRHDMATTRGDEVSNSTAVAKPAKPYLQFPLFPHATRRWAKKIRGKLHDFGPWADPAAAAAEYLDQKDALHAGRTLRPQNGGVAIRGLCNRFLTATGFTFTFEAASPRVVS
jgi:hypothetical protein